MTAAICLECGKMKTGAWTRCHGCGHRPQTLEDRARHLISTDHYQSAETLDHLGRMIGSGGQPQFVETQVNRVMQEIRRMDAARRSRAVVWLGSAALVLAVFYWLWTARA